MCLKTCSETKNVLFSLLSEVHCLGLLYRLGGHSLFCIYFLDIDATSLICNNGHVYDFSFANGEILV